MAGTLTKYGLENVDIDNRGRWAMFEYVSDVAGGAVSEEVDLMSLPKGTIIGPVLNHCVQGDSGATNSKVNLKVDAATVWTGTADNTGSDNGRDWGGDAVSPIGGLAAAGTLKLDFDVTGNITAGDGNAVKTRIWVFLLRVKYPQ